MLPAAGLLLFAASCSDDADDVRVVEKETPVLTEASKVDLEGKIWQEANPEQRLWMTNDDKLVDVSGLPDDIAGGVYGYAYYFADGKATIFQRQLAGSAVYPLARRLEYTYTVDLESGVISFATLDGKQPSSMPPFEIEKFADGELVMRDPRVYEGFKYCRCVLTPVPEAEEQQWWDEYVDTNK